MKRLYQMSCEEEKLHRYLDITGSFIISLDKNQIITYVNKRGASILGMKALDMIGKNYFDYFVPPDYKELGKKRFVALFDKPMKSSRSFEASVLTKKGEIRIINWTNSALRDKDDNIIEIISSGNDITERMLAIERLVESEKKYKALVEATDTGYSIIDEAGFLIDANSKYLNHIGYENLSQVKDRNVLEWIADYDRSRYQEHIKNCILSDNVKTIEIDLLGKDGTIIPVQLTSKAIKEEGKIELITLCNDISDRKRREFEAKIHEQQLIQADKMASLGVLVSGVAHEINNPNNFVMLNIPLLKGMWKYLQPLLDNHLEEEGDFPMGKRLRYSQARHSIPELLDGIYEGSKRIENIVRELKDYARKQDDNEEHLLSINEVVNTAFILTGNLIRKSTENIIFDLDEHIPFIKGNFQKIEQVIINLLENACQAIENPKDGLYVSTYYEDSSQRVICKIEDEGIGMSIETIKKIRDPFFTTKRAEGGTGLGLAVSTKIVMRYRGDLVFASEPGKGTIVTLSFPAINRDK